MIIRNPGHCTKLEVWRPRYSDKYNGVKEWVALLAKYKVDKATPIILVEFTKAKHLEGQRFAVKREDVVRCPIDWNGTIECYAVPMSKFEGWDTPGEVKDIALSLFD